MNRRGLLKTVFSAPIAAAAAPLLAAADLLTPGFAEGGIASGSAGLVGEQPCELLVVSCDRTGYRTVVPAGAVREFFSRPCSLP